MKNNKSLFGRVVTWTIIIILAIVALKIVGALVGAAFGLAGFLLFTVAPIILVGWVAVKVYQAFTKDQPASS